MPSVELSLAERSYVIDIEPGLLARAGERLLPYWQGRPLAVVTDENVAAAPLPAFLKSLETAGIVAEPNIRPAGEGPERDRKDVGRGKEGGRRGEHGWRWRKKK